LAAVSSGRFTDDALDRSTLADIQRKIIKKGKRNAISRLVHAKNDKEMISTWKSDLSKILLVFTVRSVVQVARLLLTVDFQTELALNTHTLVSGVDHNVTKILNIVSNTSGGEVKVHEGTGGEHLSVSTICILSVTERTFMIA
jgi:hypothetical protein